MGRRPISPSGVTGLKNFRKGEKELFPQFNYCTGNRIKLRKRKQTKICQKGRRIKVIIMYQKLPYNYISFELFCYCNLCNYGLSVLGIKQKSFSLTYAVGEKHYTSEYRKKTQVTGLVLVIWGILCDPVKKKVFAIIGVISNLLLSK